MINIAIIDDEMHILSMLHKTLSKNNYFIVRSFSDPVVALEELYSWKPDVILLDIMMPQMDGIEVLKAVKGRHKNAKVIMMTAYSTLDKVLASHNLGAENYLVKPFDSLRDVEQAIVRVVNE
jgi:DNA-binding NtrC family response regulator